MMVGSTVANETMSTCLDVIQLQPSFLVRPHQLGLAEKKTSPLRKHGRAQRFLLSIPTLLAAAVSLGGAFSDC